MLFNSTRLRTLALLTTLATLSACGQHDRVEPRILEFQTAQETSYVSVATYALAAETDAWWSEQCNQRLKPTSVQVEAGPSRVLYDFTKPARELTQMGPHANRGQGAPIDIGLTATQYSTSMRWEGNYLVDQKTGRACMRPQFTVQLSVSPQTVYVAREFPQGGCMFGHIAQHELRHVNANQSQLEATADALSMELKKAFGNRIFYGTQQEMKVQLEAAMSKDWFPWAQAKLKEVDAIHRSIDSPEEYARNATLCGGDVPRKLGMRP